MRELLEVVRWNDDDVIAHGHLRIRITNLTQPNLTLPKFTPSQGILVCTNFISLKWLDGN
jgi:hypothetical protein